MGGVGVVVGLLMGDVGVAVGIPDELLQLDHLRNHVPTPVDPVCGEEVAGVVEAPRHHRKARTEVRTGQLLAQSRARSPQNQTIRTRRI